MTTTNTIHSSNFLTEYEKERNARVMRNELLMRRLGLSDFDSYMHNASSKNKREEEDDSSDEKKKKKKEKKRRERETDVEKVVGVRRSSSRLKRGGGKGETDEQQQEEAKRALVEKMSRSRRALTFPLAGDYDRGGCVLLFIVLISIVWRQSSSSSGG